MSAISYSDSVRTVVELLRNDGRLEDIYITDDPATPSELQAPCVLVSIAGFSRRNVRIVGRQAAGQPRDETLHLVFDCWTFSGQGPADAARQRDILVQNLLFVLDDNPQLGGWADDHLVTRGELALGGESESIHARGRLLVDALVST